jgi:hypothetical protein
MNTTTSNSTIHFVTATVAPPSAPETVKYPVVPDRPAVPSDFRVTRPYSLRSADGERWWVMFSWVEPRGMVVTKVVSGEYGQERLADAVCSALNEAWHKLCTPEPVERVVAVPPKRGRK